MKAQFYPKTLLLLFLSLTILLVAGCNNDDPEPGLPDLRIYLDRFEEEAALLGYDYDLSGVDVVYLDEVTVDGFTYCSYFYRNYDGLGKRRIEISSDPSCRWAEFSDLLKEQYIFNQIGRAFLDRPPIETELCDGSPMSIMNSNLDLPLYAGGATDKRPYYVTELIDGSFEDTCIDWESSWSNDSSFYQYDPDEFWFLEDHDGEYIGLREGNEVLYLQITPGQTPTDGGKWQKTIYPNLPDCTDVSFKVTLNSEGLTGTGAAVSLRVFERDAMTRTGAPTSYNQTHWITTTDNPVSGVLDNHEETLTIPCMSRDTWFIVIFLRLLPDTEGIVRFSDVRLMAEIE